MSSLEISLATPSLQTCVVTIENFTAYTVSLKYNTLSGNQPMAYLNSVMIWEASVIPWTVPPIASEPIPQNGQSGTFVMSGFTITSNEYIIGYAVGDLRTDICAVAQIAAGGLRTPADSVYISIAKIEAKKLIVNYYTLPGYLPKSYGNWVGIWEGYSSPFNAPKPLATVNVSTDSNQGTVTFEKLKLAPDSVYTLVYFMGADQLEEWPRVLKNAAAILTLSTANGEPRAAGRPALLSTSHSTNLKQGD